MPQPIKVMVSPSAHLHQLKSGEIKYQQSKPSKPIWRILVLDETLNRMHSRAFATLPSPTDIENVVFGVLQDIGTPSVDIIIPATTEKLCPGLQAKLMAGGAAVYSPGDGFASGARAGAEWEKFLSSIETSLRMAGDEMASCEEISATKPPLGIITTDLWRRKSDDSPMPSFRVAFLIADQIIRNRGRNPENGRKMWDKRLRGAPLNTATKEAPQLDPLTELLLDPNRHLTMASDADLVWGIVQQLKRVRDAELGEKTELLTNLGALVVANHLKMKPNPRGYCSNFFSSLRFGIRDESLLYQISLGVKNAFDRLIVMNDSLVQFATAKVLVHYPGHCVDTLRRLPAHDHLEKLVQQTCGGRVSILPDLSDIEPKSIHHPVYPAFLDTHFRFTINDSYVRSRTPISPAQCFHKPDSEDRKSEFLLHVVATLPKDTDRSLPLGDLELADRMTELVNARLARTGKGVICTISPLESLGDLLVIGEPPA